MGARLARRASLPTNRKRRGQKFKASRRLEGRVGEILHANGSSVRNQCTPFLVALKRSFKRCERPNGFGFGPKANAPLFVVPNTPRTSNVQLINVRARAMTTIPET